MKTKEVVLDNVTYTVKEPSVGILFPILPLMDTDPSKFQLELAKASISINNEPIGERVLELGLSDYLKLISEVIDITGLGNVPKG